MPMTTRKNPHESEDVGARKPATEHVESQKVASMEAKIAELEAAAAEAKDRHLRLAADFENFKKRSRQEQLATIQHGSAELIARLLPGLDDLHTALDHKPDGIEEAWIKGVELSVRKLEDALRAYGLEPIKAVGAAFDPKIHEAIGHEESADYPEDTVVAELRRGYRIGDRVVRPALVKVASRPALPASDSALDVRTDPESD
jgi:molecular chaperone GrpE